ncbi:MAG: hypothetical protein RR705_02895 [Lachnospiraceae bacterium]
MNLLNAITGLFALLCVTSCTKEEIIKEIEIPQSREIAVNTEITVNGMKISDTRASTESGYTTGDGLYDKGDEVTVAAFANEGYELMRFYDKGGRQDQQNAASYTFPAEEKQTFKAEFRKKTEFIAVGWKGDIFTSTKNSKKAVRVGTGRWYSVVAGENTLELPTKIIYVAVGGSGYDYGDRTITTSVDGISWAPPKSTQGAFWKEVAYGNKRFVAVGSKGDFTTSINGSTWSTPSKVFNGFSGDLNSVTYGNGRFVTVGYGGDVYVSPDGVTWEKRASSPQYVWNSIIYDNGKFLAVGFSGDLSGCVMTSTDGMYWSEPKQITPSEIYSIAYGNGKFVTVDIGGESVTSIDGVVWSRPTPISSSPPPSRWLSIVYDNGKFFIVREDAHFTQSIDGISWESVIAIKDDSGQILNWPIVDICTIAP